MLAKRRRDKQKRMRQKNQRGVFFKNYIGNNKKGKAVKQIDNYLALPLIPFIFC